MHKKERGFTLTELMVITTIILLLATIAIAKLAGLREKAADEKSYGNLSALNRSIKVYWAANGVWPRTLDRTPHPDGYPAFVPEYMNKILPANLSVRVPISSDVHNTFNANGGWVYFSDEGRIYINAKDHKDYSGKYYTAFLGW